MLSLTTPISGANLVLALQANPRWFFTIAN
jgi:hypothetical protein